MSLNSFNKQRVVVVGGGTGIGEGIARAFARFGCKVIIGGRREEVLAEAASSIKEDVSASGMSPHIEAHKIDVADRESVGSFFEFAFAQLAEIDVLVNAAGINISKRTMSNMDPAEWDKVIAVNATGAYNVMHAVLPKMRERQDGLIINISSVAGKRALTLGGVAYCSSKFAMTALGTIAGNEEAPNGVRVTNIYPGEVETPLLKQRAVYPSEEHRATMLQPEDIAQMVVSIANLPKRAHVPELVIKPLVQEYV